MHISEINIYPVKSLKGISLNEVKVENRGLKFDRRWMLVDEKNQFLTQREFPVMATIDIRIGEHGLRAFAQNSERKFGLIPEAAATINVKIWSSNVKATVYNTEINDWFSKIIKTKCRLVLMPEETLRKVNPFYAVRKYEDTVSFADGYPFLLIGEGSLADLNSRLETQLPMNRFRPNLVVSGSAAFAEDTWKKIRIGGTIFHVVKPCERCVITTVDQAKGIKDGKEPLKTLATFRKKNGGVMFGQNLIAENAGEVIKIGSNIEVLEVKS